jgi:hypothetical protein
MNNKNSNSKEEGKISHSPMKTPSPDLRSSSKAGVVNKNLEDDKRGRSKSPISVQDRNENKSKSPITVQDRNENRSKSPIGNSEKGKSGMTPVMKGKESYLGKHTPHEEEEEDELMLKPQPHSPTFQDNSKPQIQNYEY